jgi:hypothetical protein
MPQRMPPLPAPGVTPAYWVSATVTERVPTLFSAVPSQPSMQLAAQSTAGFWLLSAAALSRYPAPSISPRFSAMPAPTVGSCIAYSGQAVISAGTYCNQIGLDNGSELRYSAGKPRLRARSPPKGPAEFPPDRQALARPAGSRGPAAGRRDFDRTKIRIDARNSRPSGPAQTLSKTGNSRPQGGPTGGSNRRVHRGEIQA